MDTSRAEELVRRLRAGSTAQLSKPPRRSGTPSDPFRLQVKIVSDGHGELVEKPQIANTWQRDGRSEPPRAVVEALDAEALDIDP